MSNFKKTVFDPLLGKTITKIEGAVEESEEILFTTEKRGYFSHVSRTGLL